MESDERFVGHRASQMGLNRVTSAKNGLQHGFLDKDCSLCTYHCNSPNLDTFALLLKIGVVINRTTH